MNIEELMSRLEPIIADEEANKVSRKERYTKPNLLIEIRKSWIETPDTLEEIADILDCTDAQVAYALVVIYGRREAIKQYRMKKLMPLLQLGEITPEEYTRGVLDPGVGEVFGVLPED